MAEITLEKTHALLEKLAEHVMNKVATKQEFRELRQDMNQRFEQVDKRFEQVDKRFEQVDKRFAQIDAHFQQVDRQFANIHGELGLIRAEQRVFSQSFDLHNKRLEQLERSSSDYNRIRDAEEKEEKSRKIKE